MSGNWKFFYQQKFLDGKIFQFFFFEFSLFKYHKEEKWKRDFYSYSFEKIEFFSIWWIIFV